MERRDAGGWSRAWRGWQQHRSWQAVVLLVSTSTPETASHAYPCEFEQSTDPLPVSLTSQPPGALYRA
jgi:hypothetical protein